ncbi:DEAD-domain-containing protein [Rhodotorula diobovata]|uniref:ATP-dependent RNA helicase n=1 Tax=Rhodotorula diobovata TaxID=5288 RepID=A0A5C5G3V4_9BASI|nr:DEAD-domain-containing protein [Rhodotorula diobovata]
MADELVLNFDLPAAAPASARARGHKGGRWTDRAKERKRGQMEQRKAARGGASTGQGAAPPQGTKRQRDDDGAAEQEERRPAKSKGKAPAGGGAGGARGDAGAGGGGHRPQQEVGPGGKKQFVSSLFTREGLPEPAPSTSSAPVAPAKPSNAPLTSAPAPAPVDDDAPADEAHDPAPELSKLGLTRELVAGLAGKLGITGPTACQAGAIPRLVPSKKRDFAHDAILRAQTGSGKTLTFLLPMVQDLLTLPPSLLRPATPSSSSSSSGPQSGPDRSIGTLALILAPTRELASQIHTVLESLLSSLPSNASSSSGGSKFSISPRALTAGLLVGGANRTHEKRRLRKGCPIVVATPGRLLDHLKTTEAFRLAGEAARVKGPQGRPGNPNNAPLGARAGAAGAGGDARIGLRWLVVDECDRLMDLGFEEQMKGILEELERRNTASPRGATAREWGRRTILCSATASEVVDRLAGMALGEAEGEMPVLGARDDVRVKEPVRRDIAALAGARGGADAGEGAAAEDAPEGGDEVGEVDDDAEASALLLPTGFTPPSQLLHHFVVVPPKLRFVALVALLRKLLVRQQSAGGGKGSKILVFMSCTDAVDFWWSALGKMRMGSASSDEAAAMEEDEVDDDKDESKRLVSTHPLLPAVPIYRLHGSLPLQTRLSSLGAFSGKYKIAEGKRAGQETDAGVLLCTSVAARGLDVKNVGCVVQVDAPTEGGVTEYVHRVGRTARAGAQGSAYTFLLPTETAYKTFLESGINASSASGAGGGKLRLREVGVEQVLREGYGGEGREYETRATDVQMGFERWVNASEETAAAARRAFQAHVRAYATHPSAEKSIFNTKALHLGHLAKSFGMREAPGHAAPTGKGGKKGSSSARPSAAGGKRERHDDTNEGGFETGRRRKLMDAEARMKQLMRGPKANGGGEFQIAGADMLEGLVKRK